MTRWLSAGWETVLKCDGNQVVVGSCSSGRHGDCPGGAGHQLLCCDLPDYYYSACDTFSGGWGVQMDCRDHEGPVMEGQCHSGEHADCHGSGNLITCCHGHVSGQDVGPTEVKMNTSNSNLSTSTFIYT